MRRLSSITACMLALTTSVACADLYNLGDYTTGSDEPRSPEESGPGTPDGVIGARAASRANVPITHCTSNAECGANVCIKATGQCETLLSPECPRVSGDPTKEGTILVGTILDASLERAALLAATELSANVPLAVVSCDTTNAIAASRHLVERLHVPAMLGPREADDVIDVTQQVSAKGGALLLTPTSQATAIAHLADSDLTWRVAPSDSQRANLVISQMNALEDVLKTTRGLTAVKLALVHRTDTLGTSARDAVVGKLVLNGRFLSDAANAANVSIDAHVANDGAALAGLVTRYAGPFRPDLVFITAPEHVDELIVPLEKALTAARVVNRPYYVVTEAAKTQALLDAVAAPGAPADLKRRIRGIAATSPSESATVRAGFETRFAERTTFAEAATYDAMYAIGFALVAASGKGLAASAPPTGASVATGLRGLGVGAPMTVGPTDLPNVLGTLASGKSVSLRGASSLLQWDAKGDIATGTVEVFCVGTASGAPAFGSSGLSLDVATQVIGGTFVQCQ